MKCEMCEEARDALFDIGWESWCGFTVNFVCAEDLLAMWGRNAEFGPLVLITGHIEHGVVGRRVTRTEALSIARDAVAGREKAAGVRAPSRLP